VHRDVKPANIILTFRGGQHDFVKVLDFGLVKSVGDGANPNLTATNTIAGTPHYLAPEAITQSESIDARADVYAIGAVGYFLLTGSPLFEASSAMEICRMHVRECPETPTARAGIPVCDELEAILLQCLAKRPADRPDDAAELLHRLDACDLPARWTPADAARWWGQRKEVHSATTRVGVGAG
jgi:serine/threonine protein kinase